MSSSSQLQDALAQRKARLAELRSKVSKNKKPKDEESPDLEHESKRLKTEDNPSINITTVEEKSSKIEEEALAEYSKLAEDISKGYMPNNEKGNEIKHEIELDDFDISKINKYYSDSDSEDGEIIEEFEEQLSDDFHYLNHLTENSIKRITRERLIKLKEEGGIND